MIRILCFFSLLVSITGCQTYEKFKVADVKYVVIYQADRGTFYQENKQKFEKEEISILSPVSEKIPITIPQKIYDVLKDVTFDDAPEGLFPLNMPLCGGFYYYVFYNESGEILFTFYASKGWKGYVVWTRVRKYDDIHLEINIDETQVEIKYEEMYNFLIKLFDSVKIKELEFGVG